MSSSSELSNFKARANRMKQCAGCSLNQDIAGRKFQVCSRCMAERYCSAECQKKGWSKHKAQCNQNAENDKYIMELAKKNGRDPTEYTILNEQVHAFLSYYRPLLVDIAKFAIELFPIRKKSGFVEPKQYVEIDLIPKSFTNGGKMLANSGVKGKDAFVGPEINVLKVKDMPEQLRANWTGIMAKFRAAEGQTKCCTAVILVAKCAFVHRVASWGIIEDQRNDRRKLDPWLELLETAMEEGMEAICGEAEEEEETDENDEDDEWEDID